MIGKLEMLTGAAALVADYNGIEKEDYIRKKLAWMAMKTETVTLLGKAACQDPITEFGYDVVMPNRMAINAPSIPMPVTSTKCASIFRISPEG